MYCFWRENGGYKRIKNFIGNDPDQAAQALAKRGRCKVYLRSQRAMAHAAGEYAAVMDKDMMQIYPYIQYLTNGAPTVRQSHKDLHGKVYRKNDPFILTHWPGAWGRVVSPCSIV